jgi:SAM-dependent methyltransferase
VTSGEEHGVDGYSPRAVAAPREFGYVTWKHWVQEHFGECRRVDAIYFAAELAAAGVPDLAGRRVLEMGFGNGAFGAWAIDRGAMYAGIEVEDELLARAAAAGWRVARTIDDLEARTGPLAFDLVVAFDVFEHIEADQLPAVLGSCLSHLAPGGVLLARVPSGDSPFGRAIQHGDPTHRVVLGSHRIRHLAHSLGCELLQLRTPALPLCGLGVRTFLRRSLVLLAKAAVYPLVARLLMDDATAVVSPNLVFVMSKPKC